MIAARRHALRGLAIALAVAGSGLAGAAAPGPVASDPERFDARGYRDRDYRAPVPESSPWAETLSARQLASLIETESPILIDVYAALRRPAGDRLETVWLVPRPRLSVPGATWLPNVGYAQLDPALDRYFRDNLARLSGGDRQRALVVFCVVDCWMSWNAIKRAHGYGYRRLYWFRDGTDAWLAEGFQLKPVDAVPMLSNNE